MWIAVKLSIGIISVYIKNITWIELSSLNVVMDILFIAGKKKKNHFQGLVGYLYLTILDHYCLAVHIMNCLPS